jgi:DNA repair photolyase
VIGLEFFTGVGATVGVEYLIALAYMHFSKTATVALAEKALTEIKAAGGPVLARVEPVIAKEAKAIENVATPVVSAFEHIPNAVSNTGVQAVSATVGVFTDVKKEVKAEESKAVTAVKAVEAKVENVVSEVKAEVSAKEQEFMNWFKNRGKAATSTPLPG